VKERGVSAEVYAAISGMLRPGHGRETVLAAIDTALACGWCGRRRALTCAACRGRLGGIRTSPRKTHAMRENARRPRRRVAALAPEAEAV
jgi:hypothetical protein